MAGTRSHHQTSTALAGAVGAGLAVAVAVWLISLSGWSVRLEGPALDALFRLRPPIRVAPRIATIDIDTAALDREKAWPWPRSRHTRLLGLTSALGVQAVGFDIFFAEPSPAASVTRDEFFARGGRITVDDFPDVDADFTRAIVFAENVFLAQTFDFTGGNVVANNPQKLEQAERRLRQYVHQGLALRVDADTAAGFPHVAAPDAIPLVQFAAAARGVGGVQVREDGDGVVRHFPLLVRYDLELEPGQGRAPCLFPSLPLLMACHSLGVQLSELLLTPGEVVLVPKGPDGPEPVHMRLNEDGMVLINWTGDWLDTFDHVSYAAFEPVEEALNLARIKQSLVAAGPGVWDAGPGAVGRVAAEHVGSNQELRAIVQTLWGAHAYTAYLEEDPAPGAETAVRRLLGAAADNPALYEQQAAVFWNVAAHVAAIARRGRPAGVSDASWADAQVTAGSLHAAGGPQPEDAPYFFFPPVRVGEQVLFAGRTAPLLQDAACFYGLTATGTHDLRPTPVNSSYPLLGVHPNLYNSILTNQMLREMPRAWRLPLFLVLGLFVALYAVGMGAARVALGTLGLMGVYAGSVYLAFVQYGWVADRVGPLLVIVNTAGIVFYQSYRREEKQRKYIRGAFEQYMHPKVVQAISENPEALKLGGEEVDATAFFSDVAGFTTISEALTPQELVALLNEYLTAMTEIVFEYDGLLDKYEGDAIIAIFGAPAKYDDHARRACHASLDMQRKLVEMRKTWHEEGRHELTVRIGLNSGRMTVGNMGSIQKMDYTMMGDTVNLAARLEGANKQYYSHLMCSEFTLERCNGTVQARELDLLQVQGKTEPVRVYEVYAKADETVDPTFRQMLEHYDRGLELYRARDFAAAVDAFAAAQALIADDGPSRAYLERCRQYDASPPPADWDGVYVMTTK